MSDEDNGFIGRWSRRKSEQQSDGGLKRKDSEAVEVVRGRMITEPLPRTETTDDSAEDTVEIVRSETVTVSEEHTDAQELPETDVSELENINIEALGFDADFTRFMQPGVPEQLRQRALKRLWRTNPILANVDGLNDYDEDYTDAALVVGAVKSAYKVGQGYLTDEEVAERDAERLVDAQPVLEDGPATDDAGNAGTSPDDSDGSTENPATGTNNGLRNDGTSRVVLDESVSEPDTTPT